jgi:hypothetical protein
MSPILPTICAVRMDDVFFNGPPIYHIGEGAGPIVTTSGLQPFLDSRCLVPEIT